MMCSAVLPEGTDCVWKRMWKKSPPKEIDGAMEILVEGV